MSRRLPSVTPAILLAVLALGAGAEEAAETRSVDLLGMRAPVPAAWEAQAAQSTMRLAQFSVPAPAGGGGAEDAQMVVYYFGPAQGGTLEANVERWQSQFTGPDGGPVEPEITQLDGKFPATLVSLRGNYARGVGVGPVGDALPDRMLLAGVVETPEGKLYPQLHGPAALVEAQRPAFVAFIEGLAPMQPAAGGE